MLIKIRDSLDILPCIIIYIIGRGRFALHFFQHEKEKLYEVDYGLYLRVFLMLNPYINVTI